MYDLTKHFLADKKQILSKIESVLNRGILEMGEEVEQFEENFKKFNVRPEISKAGPSM